jgi:hypothetical protein
MKYFLEGLLITIAFSCCKTKKLLSEMPSNQRKALIESINNTPVKWDLNPESRMKVFSDSLNNLSMSSSLPAFIYNECFDLQHLLWPDFHHPISLRQMVVSKVTNKAVIEKILKDENPRLRKICDYDELSVPEIGKSFYDLFKVRYAELNK